MIAYADEAETAREKRDHLRRRLLRGLRGYLLLHGPTRGQFSGILLVVFLAGVAMNHLLVLGGMNSLPLRWLLSTWLIWPIFVWMIYDQLSRKFNQQNFSGQLSKCLSVADADEYREVHTLSPQIRDRFEEAVAALSRSKHQRGGSFLAIPLLIILSGGLWMIWDLCRRSPWLLSGVLLDEYLLKSRQQHRWNLHPQDGGRSFLVFSGFYFFTFGFALFFIGALFSIWNR